MYSYVVTSQRATSVNHSILCNFTDKANKNLIISRGNHLEIHTLREEGLEAEHDVELYGTIRAIDHYIPNNSEDGLSYLLVLTDRKVFSILSYDIATKSIITRTTGSLKDRAGREIEMGLKGTSMSYCDSLLFL